jgi:Peptidase propeptide and YPEB domain
MKIAATAVALTLAWMMGPLAHAVADDPGPDWMPREQIRQKLVEAGYTEITELEADDGHWEGEGVKGGKRVEFHLDPNSGAVLSEKVKKPER